MLTLTLMVKLIVVVVVVVVMMMMMMMTMMTMMTKTMTTTRKKKKKKRMTTIPVKVLKASRQHLRNQLLFAPRGLKTLLPLKSPSVTLPVEQVQLRWPQRHQLLSVWTRRDSLRKRSSTGLRREDTRMKSMRLEASGEKRCGSLRCV